MIKGLSEIRRLPRLGKIRLGEKKISNKGKEYPVETSYFVVPDEVAKVYGPNPAVLDILFPLEDPDLVFPHARKLYSARGLICVGNGETAMSYSPAADGLEEIICPCDKADAGGGCRRVGNLMVILPLVSLGGIYQIDVSGRNSIININSGLEYVKSLCRRLAFVPIKLKRISQEIQYVDENTGELRLSTHYPLSLFPDVTREDLNRYWQGTTLISLPETHTYKLEISQDAPAKILPADVKESQDKDIPSRVYKLDPDSDTGTSVSQELPTERVKESEFSNQTDDQQDGRKLNETPANSQQIAAIENMARALGEKSAILSVKSYAGITVNNLEELSFDQASAVIKIFNGKIINTKRFKPPNACPKSAHSCSKVVCAGVGANSQYFCESISGSMCPYVIKKSAA